MAAWTDTLLRKLALKKPEEETQQPVMDEVIILTTVSISAMAFLLIEGMLAYGAALNGLLVLLLGLGVFLDVLTEAWMFFGPFQYRHELMEKIAKAHYGLLIIAYSLLAFALLQPVGPQFYYYSAFLLVWVIAFLLGEAMVVFLDEKSLPR